MKKIVLLAGALLALSGCSHIVGSGENVIRVAGVAMNPTYNEGEFLVIDVPELEYSRKDIVVIKYVKDENQLMIKRVIGVPNDTIQIKEGVLYLNGEILDEPYLNEDTTYKQDIIVTLTDREYWVMGDNRGFSLDSRTFGPLDVDMIVGAISGEDTE
jgi:signal peptidase I